MVFADSMVEMLREAYYNDKWGSPLQLFMPDGTAIGRVNGLEENAALRKYFRENVLNTEGYINYMDRPELDKFYEDGTLDPAMKEGTEKSLYLKWLSATYGKTKIEKFGDWLVTKEGRHTALDVVGVFFEPADGANAVLYMMEGDWGNAGLSVVCMLPLIGDYFGKGGKGAKQVLKLADITKLNRNKKILKVLENVDVFIKARKADLGEVWRLLKESWENLIDGGIYAERYVTPDGMVYWVRRSDDFRLNINLMDEAGDTVQETLQAGMRVGDAGELAGDAIKGSSAVRGTLTGKLEGLTAAEKTMVNDLLNAGNDVEIIPRSNISGQKTPDFLVNGVKTELKTIDIANTVIERTLGKYGGELPGTVEIWTIEGIIRR